MMQELTVQVGALVGTSVLLYFLTAPPRSSTKNVRMENDIGWSEDDILDRERRKYLRGGLQYSAFHRKKFEHMASMSSSASSSSGSNDRSARRQRQRPRKSDDVPQHRETTRLEPEIDYEEVGAEEEDGSRSVAHSETVSFTSTDCDLDGR